MTGFASQPAMMFLLLAGGHAFADFGQQSEYMAKAKNRHDPEEGKHWLPVLLAHALIHGAVVGLVTGYASLGVAEIALHFMIDDAKCAKRFGYEADQALHYACKLVWGLAALWLLGHPA